MPSLVKHFPPHRPGTPCHSARFDLPVGCSLRSRFFNLPRERAHRLCGLAVGRLVTASTKQRGGCVVHWLPPCYRIPALDSTVSSNKGVFFQRLETQRIANDAINCRLTRSSTSASHGRARLLMRRLQGTLCATYGSAGPSCYDMIIPQIAFYQLMK